MRLFPLSADDEVRVVRTSSDRANVVEALAKALERHRPTQLFTTADTLSFRGGFLRLVLNTNLLVPITRGSLKVASEDSTVVVRYRLTFTELVVFGTLLASWISIMISRKNGPLAAGIQFAVMWLFLVGGNWALARWRFRAFVTRSIRQLEP